MSSQKSRQVAENTRSHKLCFRKIFKTPDIQADLYAGALFITQATQIEGDSAIYVAILILLAIACVFTVAGGLSAVIYTDAVQERC